jgi:chorismate synthase
LKNRRSTSLPLQEEIQFELDRRRPGQSKITTPRKETDTCEVLSGMSPDGSTTLGTPICVVVRNKDQQSQDYTEMELAYRPSHAGACCVPGVKVLVGAGGGAR